MVTTINEYVDTATIVMITAIAFALLTVLTPTSALSSWYFFGFVLVPFGLFAFTACVVYPVLAMKYEKEDHEEYFAGLRRENEIRESLHDEDVAFLNRNGWDPEFGS